MEGQVVVLGAQGSGNVNGAEFRLSLALEKAERAGDRLYRPYIGDSTCMPGRF